ncbi:MAG: DUF4080 domain-containing protein [Limisphaerales bacterium]
MPDIVLTTLNAKFIHAAFGLRYLFANLGGLQSRARMVEFDIHQRPVDIAEILLAQNPKIIGLGIYIWNVAEATEVVAALKRVRSEVIVILGGPEVSYETESQPIVQLADHVITGEADLKFTEVCGEMLKAGDEATSLKNSSVKNSEIPYVVSHPKIIPAPSPEFSQLKLPYEFYDERDIAHRIIYVEASRGCPFTCEFCLSSLDIPVRAAPLERFLGEMQRLLDRGVRQFKFVDRTFNLNITTSRAILEFFLERHRPGNFYHFEMIPDRLPDALREVIARFPAGSLQFEVGVQTFNPEVGARISRKQNYERLEENLRFLRNETGVHIHADLIVGLPGETVESFASGFDRLVALRPQEIQVGILKRLRGTPIVRHDAEWRMVYNPHPPYEILQNKLIDFATMQKLRRFARYWDLAGNSGNFVATTPLLWSPAGRSSGRPSPFDSFMRFSEWLQARAGRTDGIALARLMEWLFEYLTTEIPLDAQPVAEALWNDYQRGGRHDKPSFLREFLPETGPSAPRHSGASLKRQARHLAAEK